MTDPGLDQRLRQRSRRAGFTIGVVMALTIAVCVAGFSVIYAALDDTIGDFVSRDVPAAETPTTAPEQEVAQNDEPETESEDGEEPTPEATEETAPTEEPADGEGTAESVDGEFTPDYQSSLQARLNFRSEPSTAGGQSTVIVGIPEGTLLEFTGEREASDDPDDGEGGWMLFRLEDGSEGWLRAIDVTEIES